MWASGLKHMHGCWTGDENVINPLKWCSIDGRVCVLPLTFVSPAIPFTPLGLICRRVGVLGLQVTTAPLRLPTTIITTTTTSTTISTSIFTSTSTTVTSTTTPAFTSTTTFDSTTTTTSCINPSPPLYTPHSRPHQSGYGSACES
ncbi:hypothetical protein E2C01_055581 [Portunus trituberculatus]|uniref:Uncharacterized protein n=1 Tax=Portunus trituberculatus TaxID=210409 RepID=A0A5B7GX77_PORTR|nr:hypothetical protein [Portunus trituberculatus]